MSRLITEQNFSYQASEKKKKKNFQELQCLATMCWLWIAALSMHSKLISVPSATINIFLDYQV